MCVSTVVLFLGCRNCPVFELPVMFLLSEDAVIQERLALKVKLLVSQFHVNFVFC